MDWEQEREPLAGRILATALTLFGQHGYHATSSRLGRGSGDNGGLILSAAQAALDAGVPTT